MKRTERLKSINFKGKEYVEVKNRIGFLAENFDYSIKTDYEFIPEEKMFIVKAELTINDGEKEFIYNGLGQEIIGSSFINGTSALENAETSAVGRACAMAGIGIIDGIASADEINKAKNRGHSQNNNLPLMDDITFNKIENNKSAFITKFGDANTALKNLETKYEVTTKYADKIKELF